MSLAPPFEMKFIKQLFKRITMQIDEANKPPYFENERMTRQQGRKRKLQHVAVKLEDPPLWKEIWENIVEMRMKRDAPVDSMGAETFMDISHHSPQISRFHVLVSLLLSSQTKDNITSAAMKRLLSTGLTIENIVQIDISELEQLIYPVGFWKKKAVYLKKTAEILQRDFNSDIPGDIVSLCKLPGIGPKMAYLCMAIAWKQNVGIGVDTHVHRICNRLNWVSKTKTPEDTRQQLEQWLPGDHWNDVNLLLVGFGQQICLPVKPKCEECLNKTICPSSTF